jgi:ribose transport system substrate-binding protein
VSRGSGFRPFCDESAWLGEPAGGGCHTCRLCPHRPVFYNALLGVILKLRTMFAVPALAGLMFTSACSQLPHTPGEKYYLVVPNTKSPYFIQLANGLNKAAGELQVHVALIGPESYDAAMENSEFQRIAATKPDGILVSVADAKLMTPSIDAAIAAGVPVITVDSDAEASKRLFFVGTDNDDAGQMGGRLLADKLQGEGNVAALYTFGQPNLEKRLEGYRTIIAMHPKMKLVDTADLKGDPTAAFDAAESLLGKGKTKVDAFILLEGQSGQQVAEILKRDNKKLAVVAMDALPATLDAIEQGWITASVVQKPFTMGYYALRMAADLTLYKMPSLSLDFVHDPNSPLPRVVDTGFTVVDQSNLATFKTAAK